MKTTNYEISKQLKEAGFKGGYIFAWYDDPDPESLPWIQEIQAKPIAVNRYGKEIKLTFSAPAYDLETILDALPAFIMYNRYKDTFLDKNARCYYLFLGNNTLGYYGECHEYRDNYSMGDGIFEFSKSSLNESLADTAGRMWLQLKKKNLL